MEESRRSGLAGPSRVASFYEHLQIEYRVLCTMYPVYIYLSSFFFFFLLLRLLLRLLFILNILTNYTRM